MGVLFGLLVQIDTDFLKWVLHDEVGIALCLQLVFCQRVHFGRYRIYEPVRALRQTIQLPILEIRKSEGSDLTAARVVSSELSPVYLVFFII